jgi:hypothetical protein
MCFEAFSYMPLLTERYTLGIWGYKHVAPPEQEPRASRKNVWRSRNLVQSGKKRVAEQEPRAKPQKTCGGAGTSCKAAKNVWRNQRRYVYYKPLHTMRFYYLVYEYLIVS